MRARYHRPVRREPAHGAGHHGYVNADGVGRVLIVLGIAAVVVGLLVRVGAFGWFGNLPGDIRIETERARVYIPITSMLLVSVAMSVLLSVFRR
jgi:hypothetical protein